MYYLIKVIVSNKSHCFSALSKVQSVNLKNTQIHTKFRVHNKFLLFGINKAINENVA